MTIQADREPGLGEAGSLTLACRMISTRSSRSSASVTVPGELRLQPGRVDSLHKHTHVRFHGCGEAFQVVATFEDAHQPSVAVLLCDSSDDARQLSITARRHLHLPQQVILCGIKARRDQYESGLKASAAGFSSSTNAFLYSASPQPAAKGTLWVNPTPFPAPFWISCLCQDRKEIGGRRSRIQSGRHRRWPGCRCRAGTSQSTMSTLPSLCFFWRDTSPQWQRC